LDAGNQRVERWNRDTQISRHFIKRDPILQEGFARLDLTVGHQPFSYADSPPFLRRCQSGTGALQQQAHCSICAKLAGVFGVDTVGQTRGLLFLMAFSNNAANRRLPEAGLKSVCRCVTVISRL
jgi:hypothetical protein